MPRTALRVTAVFLIGLAMEPPPAGAALPAAQSRCQRQLARAAGTFFERSVRALAACHTLVSRGGLPAATDCRTEAATGRELAVAALELERRINRECTDGLVAALVFGSDCFGVSTAATLVTCLREHHDAQAETFVRVLYGTSGELSARPAVSDAGLAACTSLHHRAAPAPAAVQERRSPGPTTRGHAVRGSPGHQREDRRPARASGKRVAGVLRCGRVGGARLRPPVLGTGQRGNAR